MDYSEIRAGIMWVRTHMIARHLSGHPVQIAIDKPAFFPKILYTARARIEQAVGKLTRFKRIALRCDFILVKSVHTA